MMEYSVWQTSCDESRNLFLGVTKEPDRSHEGGQVFRTVGGKVVRRG